MLKPAIRRSACDQCRAKRVRCLRPQDSTAPCARCRYAGARCVTGAAGHPGRPPKRRLALPFPACDGASTLGDSDSVHVQTSDFAVIPSAAKTFNSVVDACSSRDLATHEPQQVFWLRSGEASASFHSPSAAMDQSPSQGQDVLSLPYQLDSPSQLQGFFGANDELSAMLLMGKDPSPALGMDIDPHLYQGEDILPLTPIQRSGSTNSLMRFRNEIDQHIATVDAYYSDTSKIPESCKDVGTDRDDNNPAAFLLTCTKEFTDIIKSLMPAAQLDKSIDDTLSTETVLLALSTYLALMRLFDCVFHHIDNLICELPLESWDSIKVKSVLRIGGISSLQDMPLKLYAIGIVDAIKAHVQTLEHHMGIPAEYCLSGEAATSTSPGMFSSPSRARLFFAVMAQEDVQSLRSCKSYVESIRASIKGSMAFLND